MSQVLRGLIELVEVSELRGKVLIVTMGAASISQGMAVYSRHNHDVV